MSVGPMQLLIVALVILVLFGRGRISEMMGDFGKGIKSFKAGMNEGESEPLQTQRRIEGPAHEAKPVDVAATSTKPRDPAE